MNRALIDLVEITTFYTISRLVDFKSAALKAGGTKASLDPRSLIHKSFPQAEFAQSSFPVNKRQDWQLLCCSFQLLSLDTHFIHIPTGLKFWCYYCFNLSLVFALILFYCSGSLQCDLFVNFIFLPNHHTNVRIQVNCMTTI